ncbi:LysR family transcriptional regulator [Intrasporangium sp. YIM S08009]|uniref:LysR family transcriptional regulator n=1 Tax=Intrasporangium zincisolvens TaxID=3080018 RepID=UPI002B052548|nr:LysR family transcriptional regulator [Intrasporangium sp. YIM S08009]
MASLAGTPDIDDLRLVVTLHRTRSLGSAARELLVSQPALSQRLSRLERRCGTALFVRDTTGSTATPAGIEMVHQAEHILGHLEQVFANVRSAARARTLRIGTFAGLSAYLFPLIDALVGDEVQVRQIVYHGREMVAYVDEGSLDVAVVGVAEQMELPRHVVATRLGTDRLATFVPVDVDGPRRGARPFRDLDVVYTAWDGSGPLIAERIASLGGTSRYAATAPVAVDMARQRGTVAVLPSSAARRSAGAGDRVLPARIDLPVRLSLISRGALDPTIAAVVPRLTRELGLAR